MERWIDIAAEDAGRFRAYLASPDGAARPGIVVCTEVFGVNPHMRAVAQRFAAAGYAVLVPDLFWRIEPGMEIPYDEAGLKRGSEILAAFDMERGVADLRAAIAALRAAPECRGKIGVVGFCLGGTVAYLAGARLGVAAAVGYYAKGVEDYLGERGNLAGPLLLHFGGSDRFIPPDAVAQVSRAFEGAKSVAVHSYPGVDHGFNSDDRRAYNPAAAKLAMERTLALFGAALA